MEEVKDGKEKKRERHVLDGNGHRASAGTE